jgi:fatty acid desaturase
MNGKTTLAGNRRRRKTITALWVAVMSVGVILLLLWEMTAILYILATLGVTALLIMVATSDLAHTDKSAGQLSSADPAPAAANGTTSSYRNSPSG